MTPPRRSVACVAALAAVLALFIGPTAVYCEPIMWSGAITDTSAQLRMQVTSPSGDFMLVSANADLSSPVWQLAVASGLQAGNPTGLTASTKYYYGLKHAYAAESSLVGTFTTHPSAGTAFNFKVAFASCAWTGYESGVFPAIADHDPLFFIHMGDLHYEDIDNDDVAVRDESYYAVFESETQSDLFRRVPMVYMWDDHDYGPNNADGNFIGKRVARLAYQQFFPHYPLAAGTGNVAIYQAFTVGRVRFIVTDLRSEASMPTSPNSTMGYAQRRWFLQELSEFANYGMVVWVNTKPWMGPPEAGVDRWPGFAAERKYISDQIVALGVNNLVSLSGDVHVVAIDSGEHMDYSTSGGAGFPVFHSAPMAQYGSSKNIGPFTEGCESYRFYMNHQYGTMDVTDDGSKVCIAWKAYRYGQDDLLMQYSACTPTVVSGVGGGSTCPIPLFPTFVYVSVAVLAVALLQLCICCCVLKKWGSKAAAKALGYQSVKGTGDGAGGGETELSRASSWGHDGGRHRKGDPRVSVTTNPLNKRRHK